MRVYFGNGFKVLSLAVSIDGVLYPLYFELVKKAAKDEPKPETAIWAAQKLVKRWGVLGAKLKAKGIELPKLHLSCDSGYSDKNLAKTCQENDLTYISVAKKSHNFEIDGKKVKL
ncbi:MAG: hypothetical protein EAZ67_13120 [Cytophagales bacterium]|nr:MAG: hypothetical protein EAZ67_13120 [Cytophagales bacterium]